MRICLVLISSAIFVLSCSQADLPQPPSLLVPDANAETYFWRLDCTQNDNDTGYKELFSMSNQTFKVQRYFFNDTSCSKLNVLMTETGSYNIVTTGSTQKIDLTYATATAISKWDGYSNYLKGQCGVEEWKTGVSYDIVGCGSHSGGTVIYDIFNVATEDSSTRRKGDLYFGDKSGGLSGTSSGLRPVNLDTTLLFRHYR